MIKQTELALVKKKRDGFKHLYSKMEKPKAELTDLENDITKRLKAGENVQPGGLQVILDVTERKYPSWKELLQEAKGVAYIVKVTKDTKPVLSEKLIIKEMIQKAAKG